MTKDLERSSSKVPLQIIDDNKYTFRFFRIFGLFPITYENGKFKYHDRTCIIVRMLWFLWHLAGIATIMYVRKRSNDYLCELELKTVNQTNGTIGSAELMHAMNTSNHGSAENIDVKKECTSIDLGDLNLFLVVALGILFFILVDPVQTIILKRTVMFMPKILNEIKHLENIDLGNQSSRRFIVSNIYVYNKSKKKLKNMKCTSSESSTNICTIDEPDTNTTPPQVSYISDKDQVEIDTTSKCYNILRYSIIGISFLCFLIAFGIGFVKAVFPNNDLRSDIKDEWKFFGGIFYLVFPSLTTWFCVFFIGYQRKMYKVINELPDDMFLNDEHIKSLGDYFETMQKISKLLSEKIYKFTFGINFALFVIIGTVSTFELLQGLSEIKQNSESKKTAFGDIIYLYPILVCVFNLFISCEHSTTLISGQHCKLLNKLKGILTSLLVDEMEISKANEKKYKRVEVLFKNIKGFSPQAAVYGGFHVNYRLFVGMLFFMFSYAKVFYKFDKAAQGGH